MTIGGTCAVCGLPGHRYGTTDAEHAFDAMGCVNALLPMIEETKRWFAEAAPKINGIIGFANVHGLYYDGPQAPEWMHDGGGQSGEATA